MFSNIVMQFNSARKAFCRNDKGAVAVMFTLMLTLIAGAAGMAIDYGRAVNEKYKIQKAGDAAALNELLTIDPELRQQIDSC